VGDLPGERPTVNNRRAQSRVGKCRFQEENGSLEAIATAEHFLVQ
jgi:hypothetical protein